MNLYKSNIFVLKSFSMSKHSTHMQVMEQPRNCQTLRTKNKTTVLVGVCVCVANCVLVQCMALSINVAQGMGAKKQT